MLLSRSYERRGLPVIWYVSVGWASTLRGRPIGSIELWPPRDGFELYPPRVGFDPNYGLAPSDGFDEKFGWYSLLPLPNVG